MQRAEERRNSDRDKNVMVKLLVGYPTEKITQTCQEILNLRRESVKGGLLGSVRLGLIEVH